MGAAGGRGRIDTGHISIIVITRIGITVITVITVIGSTSIVPMLTATSTCIVAITTSGGIRTGHIAMVAPAVLRPAGQPGGQAVLQPGAPALLPRRPRTVPVRAVDPLEGGAVRHQAVEPMVP